MRSAVLIPARYASSRYPGKPLVPLLGKPMILWVAELAARAVGREHAYVATDDDRIRDAVEDAGFRVVMTGSDALTGTDRLAEAAGKLDYDLFINVQGDEPLVDPADIFACRDAKVAAMDSVINGWTWIGPEENPDSPFIPKVVMTGDARMLYMSRKALPGSKTDDTAPRRYRKQVCIYAFTREELQAYAAYGRTNGKGEAEGYEDIEILRFAELGRTVRMVECRPGSLAVDRPEDVRGVEAAMKAHYGL